MASRAALREYQADKKKASAAAVSSSLSSSSSSSSSSSAFAGRQLAIDSYKCPACEYQDMSQFYQTEKGDWMQCEHCPENAVIGQQTVERGSKGDEDKTPREGHWGNGFHSRKSL